MINRTLAKRLFITVNNPWVCDIDDDPIKICRDMDYIISGQQLTERFGLISDFKAAPSAQSIMPVYKITIHLEAIGTRSAIDLGEIIRVDVKDNMLILMIKQDKNEYTMTFPTQCEDLDSNAYQLKKNDFETKNVMTYESIVKL